MGYLPCNTCSKGQAGQIHQIILAWRKVRKGTLGRVLVVVHFKLVLHQWENTAGCEKALVLFLCQMTCNQWPSPPRSSPMISTLLFRTGHLPQSALQIVSLAINNFLKTPELQVSHLPAEHPVPWGKEPHSLPLVALAPKNLKSRVKELQQKWLSEHH